MADTLRRLTNTSSFSVLQDKLETWYRDYHVISCDQNLNRCCELIELTAKIQGQLFAILNLTAAEGSHYAGVDTLKTRLLPWLGTCFSISRPSVTDDTSLQLIQDLAEKERKIRELSVSHQSDTEKMETRLSSARLQLESVRGELVDAQTALDETRNKSATTLLATEEEILQLRADLQSAHEQVGIYKRKLDALDDYERQIRLLKEEVFYLNSEKAMLQERLWSHRYLVRTLSTKDFILTLSGSKFKKMLMKYVCGVTRCFLFQESFQTAKLAYRQFKLRVRKTLSMSHFGPESLEDAAVDYIIRNLDLYDVQTSVNDVINAMNVNPRISFPPEVDFGLISTLIGETCRVAFAMQTLDPPLDLAFASDGELYNDTKYRRSYDSEFTAPLVLYHVWPALTERGSVIVMGEAVTRRDAPWRRSRSRSVSPVRSRSLSPTRSKHKLIVVKPG
uniref:Mitochondria-eating protein n=1 Tax=Nothobranchius furzeri TaxID=105023 RepID=A0A8C6VX79_NOTFU